jgi:hypothetical protein
MNRPRSRPKTVSIRSAPASPRIVSVTSLASAARAPTEEPAEEARLGSAEAAVGDQAPTEVDAAAPASESSEPSEQVERSDKPEKGVAVPRPPASAEMPGSDADLPFVRFLVKAREARGLSLDDVAHMTKIRRAIIEALETDARRDLPEKVFVLGYVRSYAAAVGMPLDETVRRFHAAWADDDEPAPQEIPIRKGPSLSWVPVTLAAAVFAGVVWLVIHF